MTCSPSRQLATDSSHWCGRRAYRWVRLYAGLLAEPRRPKIEPYIQAEPALRAGLIPELGLTGLSRRRKGREMLNGPIFELMALIFSAMSALATLIIAMQLMRMWRSQLMESRAKRVERTLAALQFPEHVSETFARTLWDYYSSEGSPAPKLEMPEIFSALAYLENLATGIRAGVYDERLAFDRLGDALPRFYFAVAKDIYLSRSEGGAPSLYVQLERLARDWREQSPRNYGGV